MKRDSDLLLLERPHDPSEAWGLYERGERSLRLHDVDAYEEAVVDFLQAIEKDPGFTPVYAALAETYAFWGFRREISGQEHASYYALAFDNASTALRRAVERADSHRAMSVALRRGARRDEARRRDEVEVALDLDPHDAANWSEHWRAFGYDLSDTSLQKALELDPADCGLLIDVGVVLCEEGLLQESLASLHKALGVNPRNALALYNTAMVLDRQGRRSQALQVLEKALGLHPGDPLLVIGMQLLDGGRHESAQRG